MNSHLDGHVERGHRHFVGSKRHLVAVLIAAITMMAFSGSTSFALYRAALGPRQCCQSHCPHRRPLNEPPASCCRQAPPAPVVRQMPVPQPLPHAVTTHMPRLERRLAPAFARTAVVGHLDRTLLTQCTSLLR